jgi:hypothetical protein
MGIHGDIEELSEMLLALAVVFAICDPLPRHQSSANRLYAI